MLLTFYPDRCAGNTYCPTFDFQWVRAIRMWPGALVSLLVSHDLALRLQCIKCWTADFLEESQGLQNTNRCVDCMKAATALPLTCLLLKCVDKWRFERYKGILGYATSEQTCFMTFLDCIPSQAKHFERICNAYTKIPV